MIDLTRMQADSVFQRALELSGAAREAFLDGACPPGSPQRALVERLLAASDDHLELLEPGGGAHGPLWDALAEHVAGGFTLQSGERLGPWRIVRALGRGGMATVYLAERADGGYEQVAALKILDLAQEYEELKVRFAQERQILATLDHPNIARLIDAGFAASGQPYVAMEYVDGEAIDQYCDRLRLTIEQRIDLFAQVAAAVQHAHTHLIVHRDIKPSNVMIAADGQPKLLDFGIAKLLDRSNPHAAPATRSAFHLLTPEYASPEQVRGEPLTTASDVYQLGHLLYRLLTGSEPYVVERGRLAAIVEAICTTDPLRPSEVFAAATGRLNHADSSAQERLANERATTPAALRRRLAGDLDTIVLTALRKEPTRRYASALQLREDLRRHLQGRTISARTPTLRYRAAKFARRNPLGVAASALAVLAIGAGVSATAWQAQAAAAQGRRAAEVRDFLVGLFESVDPDTTLGARVTARELLDRGAQQLDVRLTDTPLLRADMLQVVGRLYGELGQYPQARALLEEARDVLLATRSSSEERARNAIALARILIMLGEFAQAESLAREAVATQRDDSGPRAAALSESIGVLADVLTERAAHSEAETLYREAITIDRAADDAVQLAEHLNGYSNALYRDARYDEAQAVAEESFELQRELYGREHTVVAAGLLSLGTIARARGDYLTAEQHINEALAMRRKLLGAAHPKVADALNDLGHVLQDAGRLDEAQEAHEQALALRLAVFGDAHPEVANSLNHLGIVQYFRADYSQAAATFDRAAPLWRAIHGPTHPHVLAALNNLGAALRESGDHERAEAVLREVLALRRDVFGNEHREVAQSLNNLGLLLAMRHVDEEAELMIREALAMWRTLMGPAHPDVADGLSTLGNFLSERGRYVEAEPLLRECLQIRLQTLDEQAPLVASGRLRLGEALLRLGRVAEAAPLIETSVPRLIEEYGEANAFVQRALAVRQELQAERREAPSREVGG